MMIRDRVKRTSRWQVRASNLNDGELVSATLSVASAAASKLQERTWNVDENKGCPDSGVGSREKSELVAGERLEAQKV